MAGLSNRTQTGDAALAILADLLTRGLDARRFSERLHTAGFIVVPLPYHKPARRGKYTGPAMIGQSHTARLVGGAS